MTKRSFPDVTVWFALAVADHRQHASAIAGWNEESYLAGFSRITLLGLLRLLTTALAMRGFPLMKEDAWGVCTTGPWVHDRVRVFSELPLLEARFSALSSVVEALPKV